MPRWTNDDRKPLGKLRAAAGLSRNEAAVQMHIGHSTLQRYEDGTNDLPFSVAEQMAVLYQVPFEEIRQAIRETAEARGSRE